MTYNVFGGTLKLAQLRNEVSACKYRTSQRKRAVETSRHAWSAYFCRNYASGLCASVMMMMMMMAMWMMVMPMTFVVLAASGRLWEGVAGQSSVRAAERVNWSLEPRCHHLPRRHRQAAFPVVRRKTEQGRHVSYHNPSLINRVSMPPAKSWIFFS